MTNAEYIKSLERHGAKVLIDGTFVPVTVEVYSRACRKLRKEDASVIIYKLQIPEAENEEMLMAIWADGFLDTGMAENIVTCVEYRRLTNDQIIWRN